MKKTDDSTANIPKRNFSTQHHVSHTHTHNNKKGHAGGVCTNATVVPPALTPATHQQKANWGGPHAEQTGLFLRVGSVRSPVM